ncbi:hypothetical protein, partial [Aureibacillus halotolerans]|uniref:hypothetical protein n=1 Tax=Aureibacillus halotolerans TaxID=1508390 RepID=UPI001AACB4AA
CSPHFSRIGISISELQRAGAGQRKAERRTYRSAGQNIIGLGNGSPHFTRPRISAPQLLRRAARHEKRRRVRFEAQSRTSQGEEMVLHISLALGFLSRSFSEPELDNEKRSAVRTEAQVRTSLGWEMLLHISLDRGFLRRSFYGAQLDTKSAGECVLKCRVEHHKAKKWFSHFSRLGVSISELQRAVAGQRKAERRTYRSEE